MVLKDTIAENGMNKMVEKRNGNKNGEKKYPILGIRIDSETLDEIETTAKKLSIKKSALVKQAIKQFFYLLDPVEKADRMMIYKNVLEFCLNYLDEEAMHELSQLIVKNSFRHKPPNLVKKELMEAYKKLDPKEFNEIINDVFLHRRGIAFGWYREAYLKYDPHEKTYYVEFNHRISKQFSKFLFINSKDLLESYTDLNFEYSDEFFGDLTLSFYAKIIGEKSRL